MPWKDKQNFSKVWILSALPLKKRLAETEASYACMVCLARALRPSTDLRPIPWRNSQPEAERTRSRSEKKWRYLKKEVKIVNQTAKAHSRCFITRSFPIISYLNKTDQSKYKTQFSFFLAKENTVRILQFCRANDRSNERRNKSKETVIF